MKVAEFLKQLEAKAAELRVLRWLVRRLIGNFAPTNGGMSLSSTRSTCG